MIDLGSYMQYIVESFSFENWVHADRVLKKHYETVFSIYDHRSMKGRAPRPFSGQAALPSNLIDDDIYFRDIIEEYHESGIYDIARMELNEYLFLSRDHRRIITKTCKTIKDRRTQVQEEESIRQQTEIKNMLEPKDKKSPGARMHDLR